MGSSSSQLNCCKYGWARASSAVSLSDGSNTSNFSKRSNAGNKMNWAVRKLSKSFMNSGLIHPYHLDESIYSFRGFC